MPFHAFGIGKKDNPSAVWRRMREPVVVIVVGDLCLLRAVRPHPPDLHRAGALGIEINKFSVRRIIRAVIQTGRGGQTGFFAAGDGNGVNVELAIALAAEGQRLAIRRPAVPIRRRVDCNFARGASRYRNDFNSRFVIYVSLVAYGDQRPVGRNTMVIIALGGIAIIEQLRRAVGGRQLDKSGHFY